ncbi:MAG: T9SS C-terminal target domain-containing protein [Bacteroidetes bacterium]|nr:MAG: T9SS C-terminal target domain-containing protein [Bacteroidota bacterium]
MYPLNHNILIMTFRLLLTLFLALSFNFSNAQQDLSPCGTAPYKSDWLKKYQQAPEDYSKLEDTLIYVPLTIHLVGTDDGFGFFSPRGLLDAFCTLTEDFEPTNIRFYIEGDINYIFSSAYLDHPTVLDGAEMMFEHNVENTLNCYFVSDPAGNCGYNLPYAGLTVAKSCAGINDHTWAHEIGHALSLAHPFFGWEGGVSHDGSVPHDFSDPAPLTVTYDYTYFLDTLILDTMIIDTAYVEFVDGSNCHIAADGFCDTAPDYLASRWICNSNSESADIQTDPSGATFQSDGTLIMSYADDACSYRFSEEQIAAMRANLIDEKPHWLYDQTAEQPVEGLANLISPIDDEVVQFNEVLLEWEAVPNATHYVVEVSRLQNFPLTLTDSYLINGNALTVNNLLDQKKYYWRVRAFNRQHFCAPFTEKESFETDNFLSVDENKYLTSFEIFPSQVSAGSTVNIQVNSKYGFKGEIRLLNILGQLSEVADFDFTVGENKLELDIPDNLPSGLYVLAVAGNGAITSKKIVIE